MDMMCKFSQLDISNEAKIDALITACKNKQYDVAKLLIQKFNTNDKNFNLLYTLSAFEKACCDNQLQVVKMLVKIDSTILENRFNYLRSYIFSNV